MNVELRSPLGVLAAAALLAACATPTPRRAPAAGASDRPAAAAPGESARAFDSNHDGKPDLWKFDAGEGEARRTVRKEVDLDRDGRVDVRYHYAPDGALAREELDLDFDGRTDTVNVYDKGEKVRAEVDLDGNGRVDLWKHFAKGQLVRKERDTNGDGKPDLFEYWENDAIDRIGQDLNGDGTVDRWTKKSAAPALPAKAQGPAKAETDAPAKAEAPAKPAGAASKAK